jgi:hypothetical protein
MSERENETPSMTPVTTDAAMDASSKADAAAALDADASHHGKIIQFDEAQLRAHLDAKVTQSVEETLNALLDAEADTLCKAGRYVSVR